MSKTSDLLHDSAYVVDMHADSILSVVPSPLPLIFEYAKQHFGEDQGNSPVPSISALTLEYLMDHAGAQIAGLDSPLEKAGRTLYQKSPYGHLDFPRMIEAGVDMQFLAVFVEKEYRPERAAHRAMVLVNEILNQVEKFGDLRLILSRRDLEECHQAHRPSILISFEGGDPLEGDLSMLEAFYRLGVRSIQLTYNERNLIGDGVGESGTGSKLTEFGVRVVEKMNKMGMLIDVSHMSETSFYDVIDKTRRPIVASHANCAALLKHRRNLTDDQLHALASVGGMVGILYASPSMITDAHRATIDDIVKHIAHAAEVAGVEHVGLGSDLDGCRKLPQGINDVRDVRKITKALLKFGFSEKEIKNILGGNSVRVLKEVLR
jgi:membrane dipeptidase